MSSISLDFNWFEILEISLVLGGWMAVTALRVMAAAALPDADIGWETDAGGRATVPAVAALGFRRRVGTSIRTEG